MTLARSPYTGDGDGLVVGVAAPTPAHRGLCLPRREQLTYTRELLTVVLLLVAFPWLLSRLLTNPGDVLRAGAISKSV